MTTYCTESILIRPMTNNLPPIPPPLNGKRLLDAMNAAKEERNPIITEMLYEHTIFMLASQPGVGKSVISTQAMAQMSSGMPVFGFFEVPRTQTIYYLQMERTALETLERLRCMSSDITINPDNIYLDDQLKGLSFINEKHAAAVVERIQTVCPKSPDVIMIDPIYAGVPGGLSKDEPASMFCRFVQLIQHQFKCAVWLNHHQHRHQYTPDGKRIKKEDSFYGSQWLKALVTSSYSLEYTDEGSILECKKDTYSNLRPTIPLIFDAETFISTINQKSYDLSVHDRLLVYFRGVKILQKKVSFKEIQAEIGVCIATLRKSLNTHPFSSSLIKHKSNGHATLYEVRGNL